MKFHPKKLLSLLMAGLMLFSASACGQTDDTPKDTSVTEAMTDTETGYKPDIKVKDYDREFVITGIIETGVPAVVDELEGEPLGYAVFERGIRIRDHLGVTLVWEEQKDWVTYHEGIVRTIQGNEDAYQLVMTHVYQGIPAFITSGGMRDFTTLPSVDLDAPYWSREFMQEIAVDGKYLMGYNDFCLSTTNCLTVNKDIAARYNLTIPYEDVRNKTWTLDKLMSLASTVAEDNGDGVWNEQDIYGIAGVGWVDMASFVTASDLKIVDLDEDDLYQVAYEDNSEKTLELLDKLCAMYNHESAFFYPPFKTNPALEFSEGRTLFHLLETSTMPDLRNVEFRFGVLPLPMYDERQANYRSLSWNGVLLVPTTIQNEQMVGDVVELLAYYTAPVKTAYYEDLLGSKLAEAPDDAEMLDIIWDSQAGDVGLIVSNLDGLGNLVCMVPNMCINGNTNEYASYLRSNKNVANKNLEKLFNPKYS
ncbi:MAG: hypothetical protein E7610_10030 [Ruminococcaceae bacterium]|nr:hypothetical protein [Oscillospiraceae bacterium]